MNDLKERLLKYLEIKGIKKATFEKSVGLSNGFVDKMGDNTRLSNLEKISNIYPDLNISWLRTGEGDMLVHPIQQSINGDGNTQVAGNNNQVNNSPATIDKAIDEIAAQRRVVEKSQEQIDRLLSIIENMNRNGN